MPRLSILDLAFVPQGATPADALHHSLDLAQHAERWGYHRFWLAEHHNMVGIASAATSVAIGYIAGGTSTIHRRMNEIVAGTPLTPASDSEIEEVDYINSTAVTDVDSMTITEVKSKQEAGNLNAVFRRNHMTNAAAQIIRGISNTSNAHVDWKHPGLERGGTLGDMTSILRTIMDEMRGAMDDLKVIRNMLMTSDAKGVEKPAMQLNDYISLLQQTEGTLYAVDYERGSDTANIDYARRVEVATLREIWANTSNAASED